MRETGAMAITFDNVSMLWWITGFEKTHLDTRRTARLVRLAAQARAARRETEEPSTVMSV